ncbi:hypothetical protein YSY43_15860 [Paenibacillus sp. YSY-4.3]
MREHTLKSGQSKTVDEMTVRELREVKAALKAEREALFTCFKREIRHSRRGGVLTEGYEDEAVSHAQIIRKLSETIRRTK